MTRQLEKLGIRFQVIRKSLKEPIFEEKFMNKGKEKYDQLLKESGPYCPRGIRKDVVKKPSKKVESLVVFRLEHGMYGEFSSSKL